MGLGQSALQPPCGSAPPRRLASAFAVPAAILGLRSTQTDVSLRASLQSNIEWSIFARFRSQSPDEPSGVPLDQGHLQSVTPRYADAKSRPLSTGRWVAARSRRGIQFGDLGLQLGVRQVPIRPLVLNQHCVLGFTVGVVIESDLDGAGLTGPESVLERGLVVWILQ